MSRRTAKSRSNARSRNPITHNSPRPAIIDRLEQRMLLAGDFGSVLTRGDTGADVATAVAYDADGNKIVAGSFSGEVDFAPGGVNVFLDADDGNGFVAKYTPNGDFMWVRRLGGAATDVAVDNGGNIVISGSFNGTRDFDSTGGTLNLTSAGFDDAYIAKFNTNGDIQWARSAGSSNFTDMALGISTDASGSVYASGFFAGTVDFNPGAAVASRTAQALTDGFIWKLNSSGLFLRVSVLAGNGSERVNDVAVDDAGNAYATGRFDDSADFDPNGGATIMFADATLGGNYDGFVWGLNSSGTLRFARRFGGGLYDTGEAVAIDAVGNVYTTGRFTYSANFNPGGGGGTLNAFGDSGGDAFVAKHDSVGEFEWAKRIGGGETDDWGRGIAVDGSRNVYVTGQFAGIATLNPDGFYLVGSAGGTDGFLTKLDTNGQFVYAAKFGGTGNDSGRGVAVDGLHGNVYVAGDFRNTVDFNPGAPVENRTSTGDSDAFVLRLTQPASPLLWALKLPDDVSTDEGRHVGTDGFGNVYIAGLLRGAGDLDPTGAFDGYGPIGSAPDVFVAKFAPDGTFLWSRVATHRETDIGLGTEDIGGLAVDFFGNVVVVGTFQTDADILDFPNTDEDLTSDGLYSDAFIWKLDPFGNHLFARKFGNENIETAEAVTFGNGGDIYVTGTFDYRVEWAPGEEIESGTPFDGHSTDVWVAKYNSSGDIQWATASGGDGEDIPTDIAFDYDNDVVRVVGTFDGPSFNVDRSYFSPGVSKAGTVDSFVARYTEAAGTGNQVRRLGGNAETRAAALDVDSSGNIYVTGEFTGTTDLNPGAATTNRVSAGGTDVFLVKLNDNADHVWSSRIGSAGDDTGRGIDEQSGNVFVTGDFEGIVDFDPSNLRTKTLNDVGVGDGFVWQVAGNGNFRSAHQFGGSAYDIAARSNGTAHVIGQFSGSGDFDPGANTSFPMSATSQDWFLFKFIPGTTPSSPGFGGLGGLVGGGSVIEVIDTIAGFVPTSASEVLDSVAGHLPSRVR